MDFKKKFGSGDAGVWVNYDETTRLKFYNPGSRQQIAALHRLMTFGEFAFANGEIDAQKLKEESMSVVFDMVNKRAASHIADWQGITDDGVEVPFSLNAALSYCSEYPEFREWVESNIVSLKETKAESEKKVTATKKKRSTT